MSKRTKGLSHFFSVLIICLQFMLAPLSVYAATDNEQKYAGDYTGDDYMLQQIQQCDSINGNWNSSTNRCIAQKEDQEKVDRTKECMEIEDTTQRNQCFEKLAKDDADIGEGSEVAKITAAEEEDAKKTAEMMKWWGVVQLIISSVLGSAANSDCYSVMISSKVGLANSLVSLGVYFFADDGTEELRSEYENKVNSNAFDAQSGAYAFLKKEQEIAKEVAERDEMIHRFTAYGYTAASIVAIGEMMIPTKMAEGYGCVVEYSDLQTMAEAMKGNVMVQGEDGSVRKINEQEAKELAIGKDTDLKAIKDPDGNVTGYSVTRTNDGVTTVTDGNLDGTKFTSTQSDEQGNPVKMKESTYTKYGEKRLPLKDVETENAYKYSEGENGETISTKTQTDTKTTEYQYEKNADGKYTNLDKNGNPTPLPQHTKVETVKYREDGALGKNREPLVTSKSGSETFYEADGKTVSRNVQYDSSYKMKTVTSTVDGAEVKTNQNVLETSNRKVEIGSNDPKRITQTTIKLKNDTFDGDIQKYEVGQTVDGKQVFSAKEGVALDTSRTDKYGSPTGMVTDDKGLTSIKVVGTKDTSISMDGLKQDVKSIPSTPPITSSNANIISDVKMAEGSKLDIQLDETSGSTKMTGENIQGEIQGKKIVDGKLDYSRNIDTKGNITQTGGLSSKVVSNDQIGEIRADSQSARQLAGYQKVIDAKNQDLKVAQQLAKDARAKLPKVGDSEDLAMLSGIGDDKVNADFKAFSEAEAKVKSIQEEISGLTNDRDAVLETDQYKQDLVVERGDRFTIQQDSEGKVFSKIENSTYEKTAANVTTVQAQGKQVFTTADGSRSLDYGMKMKVGADGTTAQTIVYTTKLGQTINTEELKLGSNVEVRIVSDAGETTILDDVNNLSDVDAKVSEHVQILEQQNKVEAKADSTVATTEKRSVADSARKPQKVTNPNYSGKAGNREVKGVTKINQTKNINTGTGAKTGTTTTNLTGKDADNYAIMKWNLDHSDNPNLTPEMKARIAIVQNERGLVYAYKTDNGYYVFDTLDGSNTNVSIDTGQAFSSADKINASTLYTSLNDAKTMQEFSVPGKVIPPAAVGGDPLATSFPTTPSSNLKAVPPQTTPPAVITKVPDPTSPDYLDLIWENVKNEQERFSPARKYDQDSSYFEPLFKKNEFKFSAVELAPGYIERLESSVNATTTSTDGMFTFIETQSFYAHTSDRSPRIDTYQHAIETGLYEIPELDGNYSLPQSMVSVAKFTKAMYNKIIPRVYAKESFGDKAGNVIYGGNEQELNFDTILFGGGMAGSMIRGAAVGYLFQTLMPGVRAALYPLLANLVSVSVINGINAGFQYKLADHSKKQIELCDKRIALLDDALTQFNRIDSRYCLQGRDNLSDPGCYCYNEDGTKNSSHANSGTCQQYWAQRDQYEAFVAAGSYEGKTAQNACITVNGHYDANCKCRAYKDKSTGTNACMKASPATTNTISLARAAGIPALNKVLDDAYSGSSTSMGTFNNTNGATLATRQAKVKKALENKVNKMLISQGKKPIPSEKSYNKIMKGILNKAKLSPKAVNTLKNKLASKGLGPKAQKALDKAIKKTGVGSKYSRASGVNKVKSKKDDFDFGLEGNSPAQQGVPKFMDKKYKYKHNDIVKKKGVSIFKVISLRYQQTGMERLFPDEE